MKSLKKSKKKEVQIKAGRIMTAEGVYKDMKSRLYQSIESSRKKENVKFQNTEQYLIMKSNIKSGLKSGLQSGAKTQRDLSQEQTIPRKVLVEINPNNTQSVAQKMVMGGGIINV